MNQNLRQETGKMVNLPTLPLFGAVERRRLNGQHFRGFLFFQQFTLTFYVQRPVCPEPEVSKMRRMSALREMMPLTPSQPVRPVRGRDGETGGTGSQREEIGVKRQALSPLVRLRENV